ncbi:uncharacterized protein DS421_13g402770 [Arachis hypogaea]|nr:uncharacterized protein DS421_13g402770 [Arachis hypogaea]
MPVSDVLLCENHSQCNASHVIMNKQHYCIAIVAFHISLILSPCNGGKNKL